ncbi:hypothetical protein FCH79_02460 [Pseudomonas koreensis]|uniref:hypothetical protein n=1 Tax=Pseudomonas koreensis TaxID=198620 RepID=UPI001575AFFB|nr:hypothetical protein [Pseudomonas koreensis]NTZ94183.1 hypothetical protein [Pseudomonas koreensis]
MRPLNLLAITLLLKLAYVGCRKANRQWVNLIDITRAYRSAAYTANAAEVEELQLQALSNRKKQKHKDLKCPVDLPDAVKSNVVDFTRADRSETVIATVFQSALSEKERAAVRDMDTLGIDAPQAVKLPRRTPVLNLTDEEKASAFLEYKDNVARPKPKRPT